MHASIPLFVDSDCALGAPFGDVDDAFAVAVLLMNRHSPVMALASIFGNTFEPWAFENLRDLAQLCRFNGPLLRGASTHLSKKSQAAEILASSPGPLRVLALGPLTNIALFLSRAPNECSKVRELVFLGTNLSHQLPALRLFDFNRWKDSLASKRVLDSKIPLTCVPCDVARRLRASREDLDAIQGPIGEYLRKKSKRWFVRARILKGVRSVPIWDLVPAIYCIDPSLFEVRESRATYSRLGPVRYGAVHGRELRVVTDFDPRSVWERFVKIVNDAQGLDPG